MTTPTPLPRKLLINEPPLQVLPTLARFVGLGEAIVLQQLHYWLQNPKVGVWHDEHKWVRNSIREWHEDNFPFWHVNTIARLLDNLMTDGLIMRTTAMNRAAHDKTWWYAIRYDNLERLQIPVERILRNQKAREDNQAFHQNGGRQNEPPFHHSGGSPSTKMVEGSGSPFHQNGGTNIHRENIKTGPETTVVSLGDGDGIFDVAEAWSQMGHVLSQGLAQPVWRQHFQHAVAVGLVDGVLLIRPTRADSAEWINRFFTDRLDEIATSLGFPVQVRAIQATTEATA